MWSDLAFQYAYGRVRALNREEAAEIRVAEELHTLPCLAEAPPMLVTLRLPCLPAIFPKFTRRNFHSRSGIPCSGWGVRRAANIKEDAL